MEADVQDVWTLSTDEFVQIAETTYPGLYSYDSTEFKGSKTNVVINCKKHGNFSVRPYRFLSGNKCPECRKDDRRQDKQKSFIAAAIEVHGDKYDYSDVVFVKNNTKVAIGCPEHGTFYQTPKDHKKGRGCRKCANLTIGDSKRASFDAVVQKANATHDNTYTYVPVEYHNQNTKLKVICQEHGEFEQSAANHVRGWGCPKCGRLGLQSKQEKEVCDFVSSLGVDISVNSRNIIDGELDIYVPDNRIAIEYNGLYWHSDVFKETGYHLNKLIRCHEVDVRLIHIFEHEWTLKQDIVKSMLKNRFNKTANKYYARNLEIREVDSKTAAGFLKCNHLQGNVNASIRIGLYDDDELVSLMTFGKLRKNLGQTHKQGNFELLRFCNKLDSLCVGGASKLLQCFIRQNNPKQLISYANRCWSDGSLYKKLGFSFVRNSSPGYFYVKGLSIENRFKNRKSELVKMGYPKDKTEKQIMKERGYNRVYDCGCSVWRLDIE